MIKKNIIVTLFIAMFAFLSVMSVGDVSIVNAEKISAKLPFDDKQASAYDVDGADGKANQNSAVAGLTGTMYTFAKYLSGLIFGVSVIVIVWAGFKYATSQGDTKVTEQAKMQIITAGIGIGVALLAMIIVQVFKEIYGV